MTNNITEAVLVERSDERLAAVEEAKRTGQEFQSVGSKGSELVDRNALIVETQKVSNADSSDEYQPLPDYLVELRDNVDDEAELNLRKAQEHSDVSAEIVRAQEETAISDAEKLRKDPLYFVKKIAKEQRERAERYSEEMADVARELDVANADASAERVKIRLEQVNDPAPQTRAARLAIEKPTDISESAASDALQQKDRIIYGEDSFAEQAVQPQRAARKAEPKRAVPAKETEDKTRTNEPVRN